MKNLTLQDPTQVEILKHLEGTERLLGTLATKLSGKEKTAEIYAMPDLGFATNTRRMHGGFFTGAYYSWETDVPFVPVDATVNCCGVSVHKLNKEIESKAEFDALLSQAVARSEKGSYIWNFNLSNHFVIYGKVSGSERIEDGYYMVLHSSASEFKKQYNGLYPTSGNWYEDSIQVLCDDASSRYLRYIEGKKAELFIKIAQELESYNGVRHSYFAESMVGAQAIDEEVLNVQHYGMPTATSLSIGAQWHVNSDLYLLLTAPHLPLYFVKPEMGKANNFVKDGRELLLTPHGLGMRAVEPPTISFLEDGLSVNGTHVGFEESVKGKQGLELRFFEDMGKVPQIVTDVLSQCPGIVVGEMKQIYSYYKGSI